MSDFPELVRLRNDIKPLSQLWKAISQFNGVIKKWKSKPTCQISIEDIEEFCSDWFRKLTFAQRAPALAEH